jgi:hypothetical protein
MFSELLADLDFFTGAIFCDGVRVEGRKEEMYKDCRSLMMVREAATGGGWCVAVSKPVGVLIISPRPDGWRYLIPLILGAV